MIADYITTTGVSILTENNHRKAYANSESGRTALATECSTEIVSEVMKIWGDTPKVEDYIPEQLTPSPPQLTPEQQRLDEVEAVLAKLVYGGDAV